MNKIKVKKNNSTDINKCTPNHIAIIMDGNRRWARERGLPLLSGHKKVIDDILEPLIEHAAKIGVKYMTFWAWSTENWRRDKSEVEGIMRLFLNVLKERGNRLHEKGVKVKVIGDTSRFDPRIRELLDQLVIKTGNNTNITAVFALNYGGRDEIIRATKRYIYDQQPNNKTINQFSSDDLSNYLDTSGIPDPEMIVRTGGEQRLSGFLLWQSQYSELIFPKWYMPEFTPGKLDELISEYYCRQRRFGK